MVVFAIHSHDLMLTDYKIIFSRLLLLYDLVCRQMIFKITESFNGSWPGSPQGQGKLGQQEGRRGRKDAKGVGDPDLGAASPAANTDQKARTQQQPRAAAGCGK